MACLTDEILNPAVRILLGCRLPLLAHICDTFVIVAALTSRDGRGLAWPFQPSSPDSPLAVLSILHCLNKMLQVPLRKWLLGFTRDVVSTEGLIRRILTSWT